MTEKNAEQLLRYLRTTDDDECSIGPKDFSAALKECVTKDSYILFESLVDAWIAANQRHRPPDLAEEVARKNSLEWIAAISVLADHGITHRVDTNPFSYFHKGELGQTMTYLVKYLGDRNMDCATFEVGCN